MLYTKQEAARVLGIDAKTLNLRLREARIKPMPDPNDKRRRLLTQEQLDRLPKSSKQASTKDQLESLIQRVTQLEQQYAELAQRHKDLREEYVMLRATVYVLLQQSASQPEIRFDTSAATATEMGTTEEHPAGGD